MPKPKVNDNSQKFFENRIRMFLRVTLISLVVCGLMIGLGYVLDLYLESKPKFLIAGLVLAFPLTQFAVYKYVKKLTDNLSKK